MQITASYPFPYTQHKQLYHRTSVSSHPPTCLTLAGLIEVVSMTTYINDGDTKSFSTYGCLCMKWHWKRKKSKIEGFSILKTYYMNFLVFGTKAINFFPFRILLYLIPVNLMYCLLFST